MPDPDWRDSGSQPSEPSASRPWQGKESAPAGATPVSKRNVKRVIAVGALVAIAAVIGIVIVWLRPIKPACLVLIGSGYEQNLLLPHNVHGWNGLAILDKAVAQDDDYKDSLRLPWDQPAKMRRVSEPIEAKEQPWKEIWEKLDIASYKEKTVVMFLSLHGMADQGEAYLLSNTAAKLSRIPFREVLDSLKTVKQKKIVLLLDASQASAHWPIGMLHNDFVKRLQEKYDDEIKGLGNVAVICSAGADQRSWASDELQNSVFGYFVTQGLQGAGQRVHERVTAWKLFKYVEEKVDKWAQTNRARRQTPILIGDENLAREIEIVHIAEPFAEPEFAVRPFDAESLKDVWSKWRDLKKDQLPQVYSPHLWRLFQDTLIRCEQLQRAGDPTGKVADLKKTLDKLYADLSVAGQVDRSFASLGNSLPMARFLGYQPSADLSGPAVKEFLTQLRKADSNEERAKLLERFKDKSAREKQYLLVQVSQLILNDIDSFSGSERLREQERLTDLERDLRTPLRPAETQLLKMLQDADPMLDNETIKLALRVRMAAETAALGGDLYGDAIQSWTREQVETADRLRREGEDWLFGEPKLHAVKARAKLKEAEDHYDKAILLAGKAQRALALRDEIAAELPYCAGWLAALPPTQKQNKEEIQALRVAVENLGVGLGVLNRDLDVDRKLPPGGDLDALAADAKLLRDALLTAGDKLRKAPVLQQNWHTLDAALSVPPADAKEEDVRMRQALAGRLRFISGELLRSTDLEGKAEEEELVRARVDRQRKLLRACVKPYADLQGNDKDSIDGRVRDFFMQAPREIARDSVGIVSDESGPTLSAAASLCRAQPGFAADLVRDDKGERLNPVDRLRRLRTHRLLLALAGRTWEDHWFEPGAGRDTYFIPAAKAYLDSARGLFDRDLMAKALIAREDDLQKKLVPAGLIAAREPDPYWTTEFDFPLAWQIHAGDDVPRGTPMVWLEVKKRNEDAVQPEPRKAVVPWPTAKMPFTDAFRLNRKGLAIEGEAPVAFHMLYRGQHRIKDLTLVQAQPKVIVRNPPAPDKAGLAVRMDSAFDYGAVSIVIDNSGSMNFVYPEKDEKDKERRADRKKGEKRRFDYALDALSHVLRKIPDNTHLSVYTLGHKEGKEFVTAPTEYRPPTRWRQEKELDNLLADLSESPGEIASPIADGIVKAMAGGFPAKFKGPKVVLVLTDGDDNYSFGSSYNPKNPEEVAAHIENVAAGLRKASADHPDVLAYVVCFIQKDNPEYQRAQAQFKGIEQFAVPGRFELVSQGERLGASIESLIRPRIELRLEGKIVDGFAGGQPVNYPGDLALKWTDVRPDTFRARLPRTFGKDIAVELSAGHNLYAVLKRKEKDVYLERGLVGAQRELHENKNMLLPREKDGWLVSLLENHNSLNNKLSQVLLLEKKDIENDAIRQTHPGFVWLDLNTLDGRRPNRALTWGREWNLPAAAFRLETPDWPINRPSKLTAWFWPTERGSFLLEEKLYARASVPVGSVKPLRPTGQIGADPVIESALWEDREVDDPAGGKVKQRCLVVRVQHAKGRPVYLALDPERTSVGSEHYYFPEAGRYTACFYKLANIEIAHLIVIDVEASKAAAQRVEFLPEERYRTPAMFLNRLE